MYTRSLSQIVEEMKSFGDFLMPYNFPRVPSEEEEDVNFIKTREEVVDGYSVILHYSKADYGDHYLCTLQVLGKFTPFLPFYLVCKVGKAFFGDKHLSLVEFFMQQKKIYCWTVVLNKEGKVVTGPYKSRVEHCSYEGLEYNSVNPSEVNFY